MISDFTLHLSNKVSEHSKQRSRSVQNIKKKSFKYLIQADAIIEFRMAFPSKATYFKLCCPNSPITKILQKNRTSIRSLLFMCCFLCRNTENEQAFLKMLMVKAFLSSRNSSYFYIGESTWLTSLPLAGNAMDPALGSWLNTCEVEEIGFLFLRSFSRASTRSLERASQRQKNWWVPYRPDRKTTNRPGHLRYSWWCTSSLTAVWVCIFSHIKTAFVEKLSIWRLVQCLENFLEHNFGPQILDIGIVIPVDKEPFIEKLCLIQTLLAMLEVQEYLQKWLWKPSTSRWEEKSSCSLNN